ncbi:MAG TPA: glycine--tRNA ligase subunit beta [Vicinamibacteria bacterium]|nr:glycine--tRNA ligase subunit beta [Vicinamibacteria bacterium]
MAELLLEVGFEEMPAPWLPGLAEQLRVRFVEAAAREHLEPSDVTVLYTPRRLVVRAGVKARQPDREEPVWGPAVKVARDAGGKWTGAAQGFAKKNGVAVDHLREAPKDEAKPGELYLLHVRKVAGRDAAEVLPGLLAAALRALAFPKRMSWDAWLEDGRGAFPFGRPIRWLVLLLGGEVVPFAVHAVEGGARGKVVVESGRATRGHRFLPKGAGGRPVEVRSFDELERALRERFVILAPGERASRIDDQLRAAARGGTWHDRGLRQEWRDLVEYPTVLVGDVPREFRALPAEVLETVLVHHQKAISLHDAEGTIARFASVVNGDGAARVEIVRGLERVVVARLRDASFFLAEDRKRPLADRRADLAGVTFHQGLGTYRDKSDRMVKLIEVMGRQGLLSGEALAAATQAARLAKADLVTLMVREFPELQGVMGGIYLAAEGAPDEVVAAVRWHYHPIAVEPEAEPFAAFAGRDGASRVFAAVSLADKLDTLAGYFGLGESPTGSRDPYGLRRAGQGAVRAVLDFWRPAAGERAPDLGALLRAATDGFDGLKQPPEATARSVEAFLLDRLAYVLQSRGLSADEVSAVVTAPGVNGVAPAGPWRPSTNRALADAVDALRRAEALQRVRREKPEDFAALAEAFKRAKNILAQAEPAAAVDPKLFEADAERALFTAVSRLEEAAGPYEGRLRGLASLRAPVGRFFDDVLVMAEDVRVRGNRLALLKQTLSLFYRVADISSLGGTS